MTKNTCVTALPHIYQDAPRNTLTTASEQVATRLILHQHNLLYIHRGIRTTYSSNVWIRIRIDDGVQKGANPVVTWDCLISQIGMGEKLPTTFYVPMPFMIHCYQSRCKSGIAQTYKE
jgi:hypothetical protein